MPTSLNHRPSDATLSVTKAARLLGVHPNTVRAWSDQGRLRYYRINPRGDRRYRLGDLHRFLAAAETAPAEAGSGHAVRAMLRRAAHTTAAPSGVVAARRLDPDGVTAPTLEVEQHAMELRVIGEVARIAATELDLDRALSAAVVAARDGLDLGAVAVLERCGARLTSRAVAGDTRPIDLPVAHGNLARALDEGDPVAAVGGPIAPAMPVLGAMAMEILAPIPGLDGPWGVLVLGVADGSPPADSLVDTAAVVAKLVGGIVRGAAYRSDLRRRLHRAEALVRVTEDVRGRLDLDAILAGLVDHAIVLFEADRAAVFLPAPDGRMVATVSRNLSPAYLAVVETVPEPSLASSAVAARRPLFATGYAEDPRGAGIRAAVIQEGYDTLAVAPLFDGPDLIGLLAVYHDRRHDWGLDELSTLDALAVQAAVAVRTAGNYTQMATWAAQLQSIQQLGARLSRLSSVREIGLAIATELRTLIDYHNVRVYRMYGDDLLPVAMQGQVGEYVDETPEQLKVRVGEGITGWVALHKVAQNLADADADPRTNTIAGTQEDLDESMLLAPMLYEDQVLGVLVLSKLGLHQFTDDDLRLLVIYASFAAQAMANADATERLRAQSEALERQVRGQRELLQITESILSTLDTHAILDQITDRLGVLVRCDNIAIELTGSDGLLHPLTAKGVDADRYMEPWELGEQGIATWVVEHNEPQLVADERNDPRVNRFRPGDAVDGSLIVLPLRGRTGAVGVLSLERLGVEDRFTEDDFELVQLFGAQVSIALQNAEVHSAVEVRARTDDLTGLLNHGTFEEHLARVVAAGEPFSLLMLDLDDFKAVNDALGHQAGDRFLREVAGAIVRAGRDTDSVFRYGGDEFTVVLPGTDAIGALGVAGRVGAAIGALTAAGTAWHAEGVEGSASIGLASFPVDGQTAAGVLLAADRACFVAKRGARGMVATAADGLKLASEFTLSEPTPVDPPTVAVA